MTLVRGTINNIEGSNGILIWSMEELLLLLHLETKSFWLLIQGKAILMKVTNRLNEQYSIISRNTYKMHKLNKNTYIMSGGMYADYTNFWKVIDTRIAWYKMNNNNRELTSSSIASLVSRVLYEKRHFPYYAFNLVVGFSDSGEPLIWNYDAVGSYGAQKFSVNGSSATFFKAFLDNELTGYNLINKPSPRNPDQSAELLVDGFQSCCERDPQTGDKVKVIILDYEGNEQEKEFQLRFD
jgi:20S proteasome subunit beta 6